MTSSPLTESLRETLALFDGSGAPRTTNEIASQLDLGRRSTYERLERLVDHGELETKKVGASARVWWRPTSSRNDWSDSAGDWPAVAESMIDDVLGDADVGVVVLDANFEVAWVNDTFERYFGLESERIIGRDKLTVVEERITDVVEDGATLADTIREAYEKNESAEQFECRVTATEEREARWLDHRSKPIESGAYAGGHVEFYYISRSKSGRNALGRKTTCASNR
ncbi:PAS domain-containing protein [Natrinema halophilum]|uniref:PAS domain-containing protein n=1 Tax=Natrinema halophilum TaxID=1699371 RepID=A0A7D5GGN9_9EURY|nr:PAS domain-containing protein [Natrinema halophilum]QLG48447.1 PAS domain-containing protein [Natrinema halophilum]